MGLTTTIRGGTAAGTDPSKLASCQSQYGG
jgi:hypothetical protein